MFSREIAYRLYWVPSTICRQFLWKTSSKFSSAFRSAHYKRTFCVWQRADPKYKKIHFKPDIFYCHGQILDEFGRKTWWHLLIWYILSHYHRQILIMSISMDRFWISLEERCDGTSLCSYIRRCNLQQGCAKQDWSLLSMQTDILS